jgi:hypothetical protein
VKVEAAWSPQMYHQLYTVEILISLEVAVQKRPHLPILNTFLEYRRIKRGNQIIHAGSPLRDRKLFKAISFRCVAIRFSKDKSDSY